MKEKNYVFSNKLLHILHIFFNSDSSIQIKKQALKKHTKISLYWKKEKETRCLVFKEHQYVENKNKAISLVT